MPILLKDAGLTPRSASLISALFPLGGVCAIFFGWLMDRFKANLIVAGGYAATATVIYIIGQSLGNLGLLISAVFLSGIFMNAAQASMGALAASFYPTQARVTGVAWMLGIGRFGGIAGSFFIAELTRRHFEFNEIYLCLALQD